MFWISILACQTNKTSETVIEQEETVEDSAISESDDIEISFPSFDICNEQTMISKPGSFACSEISVRPEMAFAMVRVGQVEGEYIHWRVPLLQSEGNVVFVTPMLLSETGLYTGEVTYQILDQDAHVLESVSGTISESAITLENPESELETYKDAMANLFQNELQAGADFERLEALISLYQAALDRSVYPLLINGTPMELKRESVLFLPQALADFRASISAASWSEVDRELLLSSLILFPEFAGHGEGASEITGVEVALLIGVAILIKPKISRLYTRFTNKYELLTDHIEAKCSEIEEPNQEDANQFIRGLCQLNVYEEPDCIKVNKEEPESQDWDDIFDVPEEQMSTPVQQYDSSTMTTYYEFSHPSLSNYTCEGVYVGSSGGAADMPSGIVLEGSYELVCSNDIAWTEEIGIDVENGLFYRYSSDGWSIQDSWIINAESKTAQYISNSGTRFQSYTWQ